MSIFASKKSDTDQKKPEESGSTVTPLPVSSRSYGIAEAIQLMRSLPVDQNADLVVRVVRATLASLNVRVADIIQDAAQKQKVTQERIASLHGQIGEMEKELEARRREIAALELELRETTSVKDRLQMAEKAAAATHGFSSGPENTPTTAFGSSPPPPPPLTGKRSIPKPVDSREESAGSKD
jgi:hypothetical protein